jgi:ribosome recycling factor
MEEQTENVQNINQVNTSDDNKLTKNVVRLLDEENSYIASAKERMNDVIDAFIANSEGAITLNDFSQIFKTVTVWIKFRPRKLGQYVEVMKERTTAENVCVRYASDEYIPHIKEVLKEHRLQITSQEPNIINCKPPRPKDQDIEIAVQKIKVVGNSSRNSLAQVKADSIQRLQAALKNEYLEAKDVKFAITAIEKVEQKFAVVLVYLRLEAEKKVAGKLFRYDSAENQEIHKSVSRRVAKYSYVEI